MTSATRRIPLHERDDIHGRRWFLLGVMCLSLVLVVMSVSGLNVAIPSIQQDLNTTATDLQWIIDSYAIIFAGLLLTAGALGDRFGRKEALLVGLAVFAGGSVVGVVAGDAPQVIISRSIMGIGAALIMPATLSLVTAIYPPRERTTAIAVWAGFAGAGGALGPLVVGFLLTGWWIFPSFWWGAAFVMNIVVVVVVFTAVAVFAPRSRDDTATPLDPVGAILSLVGLAALLYAIIEGPQRGWTDSLILASFVTAAVVLGAFVLWEARAEHPMLPLRFFRDRRFSVGSGVITFGFMVMFGFFFLFSQYLQFARGYSPLEAGAATLPMAVTLILVSPRSAHLTQRLGLGRVITAGFILLVAGFIVMATIAPDTPYLVLVLGMVLLGSGMGITMAPATGAIMSSVPLNKAGVGSAVNDTTREVGGALGIAILGSIATSVYRGGVDISALPDQAQDAAGESVGAAIGIAQHVGGEGGALLIAEASQAFTDAFNTAMLIAAAIGVASAVAAAVAARRIDDRAQP
jgi:EmrB/QacA subfamily drug resistance transporter